MCHALSASVTYVGLPKLHVCMLLLWEVCHNVCNEVRTPAAAAQGAAQAEDEKRMRVRQEEEFMRLTGSTEADAELLPPALLISDGGAGDPAKRVTSYTWMMEKPPGGK